MERGIGDRIKGILDYRGMSQKELAERANITEAAISRYIKGDRVPRAITVANIAKALNVSVSELVEDNPCDSNELDNAVRLVARNARVMTEEQREQIIRALATR